MGRKPLLIVKLIVVHMSVLENCKAKEKAPFKELFPVNTATNYSSTKVLSLDLQKVSIVALCLVYRIYTRLYGLKRKK